VNDRAPPHTHLEGLNGFLRALDRGVGAQQGTPKFDPLDGGDEAEILVLLETPAPGPQADRLVSIDNPTGTARNLKRAMKAAGLDRRRIVLWNTVPWLRSGSARPLTRQEIASGLATLEGLVTPLHRLRAVVLCGRVAAMAAPTLTRLRPEVELCLAPHPSPTFINTAPEHRLGLQAAFAWAAALITP